MTYQDWIDKADYHEKKANGYCDDCQLVAKKVIEAELRTCIELHREAEKLLINERGKK
jgi:hypothetical protein